MKAVLYLTILAVAFTCVFAAECDPDGNGQPVCDSSNVGQPSRNNWDPTRYWLCSAAGAQPESVRCPDSHLYNSATQQCIPADDWVWTPPCPEAA